ncbi:MAG: YicC family protein [Gemmatimonadetes bacterium]|nr:YicC family protein [Gemmatimonadota bacterium]
MTGFGAAEGSVSGGRLQIEIRSVNHRHFNLQLKVPAELLPLEAEVRERLRARVARGHVTVAARWTEEPVRAGALRLNLARARELVDAVRELQRTLDLPGDVDVGWIVRQPDVLGAEPTAEPALDAAQVLGILDRAADALQAMRDTEGASLVRELSGHLAALEVELGQVERRAPDRLVAERDRRRQAVATLLDGGRLDESRLAQEIALLAERLDLAEEIARLKTHLAAARAALAQQDAVGRQLGFLGQEMLREINTIGSKANDAAITQAVILMKGELEKFREQVENLE